MHRTDPVHAQPPKGRYADLTPDHRSQPHPADTLRQLVGVVAGIGTILLVQVAHR